ncbi:MAG: response regulator transcription factor [Synergistaceae bacterium]|nr:response regulator transcription factor [Synergistaceae bacterium]
MMNSRNSTNRTNRTNRMSRMIDKKLTSREILVLTLTAAGFSDREIGEMLYVSNRTVNNYVLNIRAKLNAKSRTQAAVKALKKGLLSFEEIEKYEAGVSK